MRILHTNQVGSTITFSTKNSDAVKHLGIAECAFDSERPCTPKCIACEIDEEVRVYRKPKLTPVFCKRGNFKLGYLEIG